MINNLSDYLISRGASITILDIQPEFSEGLGMCNPSIFIDGDDILVNIRRVNYMLHQSPSHQWTSVFGPSNYHHPDNDLNLRTENYIGKLNKHNFRIDQSTVKHVDYSSFYTDPKWNFVGEEDARIVKWDNKIYLTGCRRDTEETGISRMELSEINKDCKEIARHRVPALGDNNTYCEKNWMPILSMPYHYVKWCNPLEIVKYDPISKKTEQVLLKNVKIDSTDQLCDLRGSSQVIDVDDYHVAIVHEVNLWLTRYNEKECRYYTRFIVWDKDWNVVKVSQRFWFMNFTIEFTTGLAYKDGMFYIPFAVMDNASFLIRVRKEVLFGFIGIGDEVPAFDYPANSILLKLIKDINNPYVLYELGKLFYIMKQHSAAYPFLLQSAECSAEDYDKYKDIGYDAFLMSQKCIMKLGNRLDKLWGQLGQLVDWDSNRYEAYDMLSTICYGDYEHKNDYRNAFMFAKLALDTYYKTNKGEHSDDRENDLKLHYYVCAYRCGKDYVAVPGLKWILANGNQRQKDYITDLNLNL